MDVALTFTWFANRPNIGLMGVHLMQKALDVSIAHARTRAQFGSPIGRFQLVQEMLAEMSMALDRAGSSATACWDSSTAAFGATANRWPRSSSRPRRRCA